jgi:DNA helicase-2/ATP-dependent DNA helicase PcrA
MLHDENLPAYFAGLNPEQLEAARHASGPMLVLAGAGSGKTRVLTTRVAHLIKSHGASASRIMAVTFTNKAAGEMKERISHLIGGDPRGMYVGTFHAFGSRVLRAHAEKLGWKPRFTIYDQKDAEREVKRCMLRLDLDPGRTDPGLLLKHISDAKSELVLPSEYQARAELSGNPWEETVGRVYEAYEAALRANNAFDFDDLLVKPIALFHRFAEVREEYQRRYDHLLVDEYQDTNHAQYRMVRLLGERHGNVFVVGDDDQAIYGWRGADIRNILDFEKDYPSAKVVRLEQNYRSTGVILDAANGVIENNTNRKGKTLRTDRLGGDLIREVSCERDLDEARFIAEEIDRLRDESRSFDYRDVAVLYRTNMQARVLETEFRTRSVPYKVVGATSFFGRREIVDMTSYLRLVVNPDDGGAFERVVNVPKRKIGAKSVELLRAWADGAGMSLLDAASRAEGIEGMPRASAASLTGFARTIRHYADRVEKSEAAPLMRDLIRDIGLIQALKDEGPEGEDRAENVQELISGAAEFDQRQREAGTGAGLEMYVEEIALMSDPDTIDTDGNTVTLMTVHASKGLEFPVVFLGGLEDGLFPSARAMNEPAGLEEERRLMYVAITRARQQLYLLHAGVRRRGGDMQVAEPSMFLQEIDDTLIEVVHPSAPSYGYRGSRPAPRATGTGWSGRDWVDGGGRGRDAGGASAEAEPVVEYEEYDEYDQDRPSFVRGEVVAHPDHGDGEIVQVSGYGRDLYVTVEFDSGDRQRLLARRSGLRRGF